MMRVSRNLVLVGLAALLCVACDEEPNRPRSVDPDGSVQIPENPTVPGKTGDPMSYPRNLSWANIDTDGDGVGENYITSVKAQPCGDCYLYAAIALVEARWQIDHKSQVSLNLSEQNVHNCMKIPCDGAGDLWWVLPYIRDFGVMPEENMPTGFWMPSCENCIGLAFSGLGIVSIENVPFYRITRFDTLTLPKTYAERKGLLVAALQDGPVAIGVDAWGGYANYGGTLYCKGPHPSGHAVMVVGYRERGEAFLVKNSHGEGGLLTMVFEGGDRCGFASEIITLPKDSVYSSWGWGATYCYSTKDSDGDGVPDSHDNCPWDSNPKQEDSDKDGWGNACDRCPDNKSWTGYYCSGEITTKALDFIQIDPSTAIPQH